MSYLIQRITLYGLLAVIALVFSLDGYSQSASKTVRGTVRNENGQPISGVNIVEQSTNNGTVTDHQGNFSLRVQNAKSVLVFSNVGFQTQTMIVRNQTDMQIILQAGASELDQVVVVGYGSQKKKDLTSAVTSIKEKDFNQGPVANSPLQLIQGKVPGLALSRAGGGDPSGEIQMQLRGVSTVKGNLSPLIVIDGIPGGNLNTVVPEDIESIDVLRDGSAAAIYGTRGTNGVVIITTKKGKSGMPTFQYNGYGYFEKYHNRVRVLNGDEFRQLKTDFANSDNPILQNKAESIVDYGGNTNWFEAISQNKLSQVHSLSVSGGSQKTNYYASVNYRDIQGILKRSYNRLTNYRLSLSHLVFNDRLRLEFSMGNTNGKSRPSNYGMLTQALLRNPTLPVYNEDGSFYQTSDLAGSNLVGQIYLYENDVQTNENLINTRATFFVTNSLKLSLMGGLQRYNQISGIYYYRNALAPVIGGTRDLNGEASRSAQQNLDRTLEATVSYDKLIGEDHQLSAVGGYSFQDFTAEGFGAGNRNFISDAFTYNNLNAGAALAAGLYRNNDIWSNKHASRLIAFFARAIYSYKDKYMLTAGFRREGSSKFGNDDKWGLFPAVTAGWRISGEEFMKDISAISDLKIRVGYGVTGNQGIDEYVSLERLSPSGMMLYNGAWITGYAPSSNPNPNLRWEKKTEKNLGLDLGLKNNRIIINLDLYERTTSDLLYEYVVPVPPNLYTTLWTNVGGIKNRGVELGLTVNAVKTKDINWEINFNASYNKNKLVSLSNDQYQTKFQDLAELGAPGLGAVYAYRLEEGQPIGNMYGFKFAGFTDDGKWQFWSADNSKTISATEGQYDDKRVIGNGLPKYWIGFTNSFVYKNFDANVMTRGAFGFNILNVKRLFYENRKLIPSNILKSGLTSPVVDDPQMSDYYVEKGDYIKIDVVSVGYTIPFKSKYLNSARIYVAGKNLITFTDYKGHDPELNINGLTPGYDKKENSGIDLLRDYPSTRSFSFGVTLKF
ncbi:MAG: SusC/RagA family TonB-linked outer membrane protein [Chitinophagaceae bacterium]|nr:SusC/RagA family TonB-linked outer membrane protein [Chitinophagaceae bacterium]